MDTQFFYIYFSTNKLCYPVFRNILTDGLFRFYTIKGENQEIPEHPFCFLSGGRLHE